LSGTVLTIACVATDVSSLTGRMSASPNLLVIAATIGVLALIPRWVTMASSPLASLTQTPGG